MYETIDGLSFAELIDLCRQYSKNMALGQAAIVKGFE